ncbi:MAG: U32 family peptidase [Burkholderiales bacterium]|nr:U32 family peptidase [Burkholderiales bacterium]
MELVSPAGTLAALREAVDAGADSVYLGLRDSTNARNADGLNFDDDSLAAGLRYARDRGCGVQLAVNTYPQISSTGLWRAAIDKAAGLGVDSVILADPGLMRYAARRHPGLRLHLSVLGSATHPDAICLYQEQFNVRRVVLPRVLSLEQVKQIAARTTVEIEVWGFGTLCVMTEGRCSLSSYVTGESPNTYGVCSPVRTVRWRESSQGLEARIGGVLVDRYDSDEMAGTPTPCRGRFNVGGEQANHAMEEPSHVNTLQLLPRLAQAGVRSIRIEGRQRGAGYTREVTAVWREALDQCAALGSRYAVRDAWLQRLEPFSEGRAHTLGAAGR